MCKYCESTSPIELGCYSSNSSAPGVSVSASVKMIGDKLILSGAGRYVSSHDLYYESWGIDSNPKYSDYTKPHLITISHCPFCGSPTNEQLYLDWYLANRLEKLENRYRFAIRALSEFTVAKVESDEIYIGNTYFEDPNSREEISIDNLPTTGIFRMTWKDICRMYRRGKVKVNITPNQSRATYSSDPSDFEKYKFNRNLSIQTVNSIKKQIKKLVNEYKKI